MELKYSADEIRKRQEEMHGNKYTKERIISEVMAKIAVNGAQGSSYPRSYVTVDVPHKYLDLKELKKAKAALKKEGYRVKEKDYSSEVELTVSWDKFDWGLLWVTHRKNVKFYSFYIAVGLLIYAAMMLFILSLI
ncbi:hypothetical protein 043JT007_254 [Bacillus phage 043JT007]|nr:hypothetical protein 043JT007_254 [Bacillus phage 043JT007]